jgi:hypothetical protein
VYQNLRGQSGLHNDDAVSKHATHQIVTEMTKFLFVAERSSTLAENASSIKSLGEAILHSVHHNSEPWPKATHRSSTQHSTFLPHQSERPFKSLSKYHHSETMNAKRINTLENSSCVVREDSEVCKRQQKRSSRRPIEVLQVKPQLNKRAGDSHYEPVPLFTTTSVFTFGAAIILLANLWPPLALLVVWICARLQRYWFRANDEPSHRRRLLKEFTKKDQLTAPLRYLPDHVHAEESYWVNRR